MKKFFEKFIDISTRYSFAVISVFAVALILQLFFLKNNFSVNSDLEALFHGENATVKDLQLLRSRIGATETLSVVSKADSIDKNIEFFKALVPELEKNESIRFVEFEQDITYLEERALLFLPLDELLEMQEKIQKMIAGEVEKKFALDQSDQPDKSEQSSESDSIETLLDKVTEKIESEKAKYRQQRYFSTSDGLMMEIKIHPESSNSFDMVETSKVIGIVENIVFDVGPAKYGVTVETGGDYKNKLKQKDIVKNDLFSTMALCVFLLAITIIFYFKTISSLFIILIPLSFGIISAITVSLFFVGEFSLISAFSFAMLYGLGIDFAIHLLARYSEERAKGAGVTDALKTTCSTTLSSIISGALTTAAAFFSLIFVQFKGFSDFGIVAGTGVLTSLIAIVFLFPAFVITFEKIAPLDKMPRRLLILSFVNKKLNKRRLGALSVSALILIFSVISLKFISFEYDMGNLGYPVKERAATLFAKYRTQMKEEERSEIDRTVPNYILTDSLEETKDAHDAFENLIKEEYEREFPRMVISVFTFIPSEQDEKLRIIRNTKRMIERKINIFDEMTVKRINEEIFPVMSVPGPVEIENLPQWIKNRTMERDGSFGKVVKMTISGNKKDIQTVMTIKEDFGTIKGKLKEYKLLGTYFLLADIKDVVDKEIPMAVTLALFVVFVTLIIMFRSGRSSFLILLPLVTGLFWMIGLSFAFDISFTLYNIVVIPTVVGIGVDSSIHFYHRSKEENIPEALETTGGAVLFSSLTTFTGFLSIAFAHHLGIKSIGVMASMGIVTVTVATLVLFPVFLTAIRTHRNNR